MRFFRLVIAALCLATFGLSAVPAHAATLSFSPPTWENRVKDRLVNKFNRKDCIDDATATFSVSILGAPTNALFQVWSGTGCDQYANRSPTAVSRTCTLLTGDLNPINQNVVIHLRDMVAAFGATVDHSEAECDATTTAGQQNRSLYFVVSDPSTNNAVVTGTTAWPFTYDVKAPAPPSAIGAGSGDGSLVTSFTPVAGETNLLRYHFYCSEIGDPPATASGGTTGAGGAADTGGTAATGGTAGTGTGGTDTGGTATDTGGTAGTDTGGTTMDTGGTGGTAGTAGAAGTAGTAGAGTKTDPDCHSSILVPGRPPPAGAIDCGSVAAQAATGGETSPVLKNGTQYVVAVATEDNVNNIGVLSELACNVPKDVTGFYEAYTEAGGQAGGGYCTFAPARRDAPAMGIALLLGACALWRRRK